VRDSSEHARKRNLISSCVDLEESSTTQLIGERKRDRNPGTPSRSKTAGCFENSPSGGTNDKQKKEKAKTEGEYKHALLGIRKKIKIGRL